MHELEIGMVGKRVRSKGRESGLDKPPTPEQMLMDALNVLKELGVPPDSIAARMPIHWQLEVVTPPELEDARIGHGVNHVIYVASLTPAAMVGRDPWTRRTMWSLFTARDKKLIVTGGAEDAEQAMRYGEIAYRALLGVPYTGDA